MSIVRFLLVAIVSAITFSNKASAHNGKIAYARPLGNITVDGKLSDWPKNAMQYNIDIDLNNGRLNGNHTDFSGFFQVGYRLDNKSLYLAITVTDNDFIEDTTADVRFNTQDCLELCLDARHLQFGSGVASFMYSKKLRNTNHAFFDPFAKSANWNIMEVAMTRNGNVRYYEWRIMLGDELKVDKSVGLDFQFFDKDNDGSFSAIGWGKGGYKFRTPSNLGDIVLLPAAGKLGKIEGKIAFDTSNGLRMPGKLRFASINNKQLWFDTELDSTGKYAADLPVGKYRMFLPDSYVNVNDKIYTYAGLDQMSVNVKPSGTTSVRPATLSGSLAPDLLPQKGVLPDFNSSTPAVIDNFIESYRKYYRIPGVSLALIKDGKVVYHKTYGEKNTVTKEKVDNNTLFEAASVTKPVFSFAVQRLAEKGVIDLDKPLYEYLPYPDIADDERYKLITARHVLTHRTGFPNWRDGKLTIKFTPGTDYGYSGEGFEYLKIVVEKITGKKVEQVLKEEVIEPMGLYHTFFSKNDSLARVVANGHYDMLPTPAELPESPGMAWSMHTEAKIFTRFMLYLMEQKGLSEQMYNSMFSKHSDFKFDPGDELPRYPSYMGMSLEIRETPFGKTFGHGGNNGDFRCQFEVYKDQKMGYAIFTNADSSNPLLDLMREFLVEGKDPKRK